MRCSVCNFYRLVYRLSCRAGCFSLLNDPGTVRHIRDKVKKKKERQPKEKKQKTKGNKKCHARHTDMSYWIVYFTRIDNTWYRLENTTGHVSSGHFIRRRPSPPGLLVVTRLVSWPNHGNRQWKHVTTEARERSFNEIHWNDLFFFFFFPSTDRI